ncbi:MAG: PAS domain S-box protein [Dehalococcoidia bacterium]|nr:PAS domain S-box protein [Dehalococcoidia bacterium]
MNTLAKPRLVRLCRTLSIVFGALAVVVGIVVLLGWTLDLAVLKSILPDFVSMKANTALAFVLAGTALLLLQVETAGSWRRGLVFACAGAVALLGTLNLAEYLWGLDLGIDQLLFRDPQVTPVPPGRMAVTAALSFLLLGSALLISAKGGQRSLYLVHILSLTVNSLSYLALIGYAYDARALYDFGPYSAMALHTALTFAFLSLGVLFVGPDKGIMVVATSNSAGGRLIRQFLPLIVLVQILFGKLVLLFLAHDDTDDSFFMALVVTMNTLVSAGLVFPSAWSQHWTLVQRIRAEEGREAATERLRESERLLNDTQKISKVGGWEYDVAACIVFWTDEVYRIYGVDHSYDPNDITKAISFYAEKDQKIVDEAFQNAVRRGRPYDLELQFNADDGTPKWVRTVGHPIIADGKIIKVVGNIVDISEKKRAEKALEESESRYHNLARLSPVGIFYTDNDGNCLYVNERWTEISGLSFEEALGEGWAKGLHPDDLERVLAEWSRCARQQLPFRSEYRILSKGGKTSWVLGQAIAQRDETGEAVGYVGTITDITDRKLAIARFGGALATTQDGFWIMGHDLRFEFVNQAYCQMMGYDAEELLAMGVSDVEAVETPEDSLRHAKNIATHGRDLFSTRHRRKDGSLIELEVSATYDKSQDLMFAFLRDISERRKAEEALRESETRLLAAQVTAQIGNWDRNLETNELYWSAVNYSIFGFDPDKVSPSIGAFMDSVDPDEREYVNAAVKAAWDNQKPYDIDMRIIRPDGTRRVVNAKAEVLFDGNGKAVRIIGTVQDITDRKLAEEALVRLKQAVESSGEVVFTTDRDGIFTFVNPSFTEVYGFSADEVVGKTTPRVLKSGLMNQEAYQIFWQTILGGYNVKGELTNKTKDGRMLTIDGSASPILDDNGRIIGFLGIQRDVTERKRMEEQLSRAQRLEMAGQIAGQVAHDFNNLLTPMTAYPELMRIELPANHPALRYADLILSSAEQMAAINDDLLTLSRRGHFNQEPTDFNSIVREASDHMSSLPSTLHLEMNLASDLMPINCSRSQLLRVISNLLVNARDAMQDRGLLTIKTGNVSVDESLPGADMVVLGKCVLFQVTDTGCGMSEETRSKIFEPFFTTKHADRRRGSGLGLSIVQAIVGDHKGYVNVESKVGIGTTFSIYLPVSPEAAVQAMRGSAVQGGKERILLVDDDELQREVAGSLLTKMGYEVNAVSSGLEALAYLREHKADLILLDMIMPGGIDGLETYRQIVQMNPGQKAIIVSGHAETNRVREAQALGSGQFLRKPITLQKLAKAVRDELERA